MEGWLIYRRRDAERNKHYITFYEEACRRRGINILLRYFEDFSYGTGRTGLFLAYAAGAVTAVPDFVVMRADVPVFSEHLELMGCRVFNNARLSAVANDKLKTLQLAASLQIPVPETRSATHENAMREGAPLGYPLVIKPRDGHGGQDVLWVRDELALQKLLPDYRHTDFLLQRPVSALGRDLRVYIIGGRPVAAMLRSQNKDFRSNYCLGGSARAYALTEAELAIIDKITAALEIDFAGIDFMFHNGRPVLNEIEDVVGARMLYQLTDIDVVDLYVAHIVKKCASGR